MWVTFTENTKIIVGHCTALSAPQRGIASNLRNNTPAGTQDGGRWHCLETQHKNIAFRFPFHLVRVRLL